MSTPPFCLCCTRFSIVTSRCDASAFHVSSTLFTMLCMYRFSFLFQTTLSRMLPENVWREVLEYANPEEYAALARQATGVSREFYWLLKNSVTTIRIHRPIVPLCGLVWLHSRDRHFSSIKCVEGELFPLQQHFSFCFLCPSDTVTNIYLELVLTLSLLAVGFPAKGVDLRAVFLFAGCRKRHPIKLVILASPWQLPTSVQLTRDRLQAELAMLGVDEFTVEVLQSLH